MHISTLAMNMPCAFRNWLTCSVGDQKLLIRTKLVNSTSTARCS